MRIALLADIHGNAFALERVLAEPEVVAADVRVCLGDLAVLGPDPARSIDLVRDRCEMVVRGNTDEWLVDDTHPELVDPWSREVTVWTRGRVGAERLAWIDRLPMVGEVAGVTMVHATARSTTEVVTDASADEDFGSAFGDAVLVAAGHTHLQMDHRAGRLRFVNPGSVGLPGAGPDALAERRVRSPNAAYWAMLVIEGDEVAVSMRETPLPVAEMTAWAMGFGLPLVEWWCGRWADAG